MSDYIYYDSFPERFRELFKTQVKLRNMHFNKDRPIDDERNLNILQSHMTQSSLHTFLMVAEERKLFQQRTKIISGAMKKIALST